MAAWAQRIALGALWAAGLAACGGGGESANDAPLNIDYSSLRVAESREGKLVAPSNDEQLLQAVRNGLRLSLGAISPAAIDGISAFSASTYSATTVQVDGVDEADRVKYDGRHIFSMRQELVSNPTSGASITRNVLQIVRTNAQTADAGIVTEFSLEGEQSAAPLMYQQQSADGVAQALIAVSTDYRGWLFPQASMQTLVVWPDRTVIQTLDVRDPAHVSQTWKVEIDGWLRASRKVGDTLYLVSSFRPRLSGIVPAETTADREANERRIRDASSLELLPKYRENGGEPRALIMGKNCVLPADLRSNEGYTDLLVITALNLTRRQVSDVSCVSTNFNGVYVSPQSLYVAGATPVSSNSITKTLLHKFTLDAGSIRYRASGAVDGQIGWRNASYFMDEHDSDLRIVTTHGSASSVSHHLSVLRETSAGSLQLLSTLPNAEHPEPIGKPNETVASIRFFAERAYVVTAQVIDPLYVIDLNDPENPLLAGALEIPGVSMYLQPLGASDSQVLLSVGRQMDSSGRAGGVKVELFDVREVSQPRSLGAQIFGSTGSWSEALDNPHALTLLSNPAEPGVYRVALPVDVFEPAWSYSGLRLLKIETAGSEPQLLSQGVIKTAQAANEPYANGLTRGVLHGESVFAVSGARVVSSLWENVDAE